MQLSPDSRPELGEPPRESESALRSSGDQLGSSGEQRFTQHETPEVRMQNRRFRSRISMTP
eukprot:5766498-Alexandrium_andersonii.AAC.1